MSIFNTLQILTTQLKSFTLEGLSALNVFAKQNVQQDTADAAQYLGVRTHNLINTAEQEIAKNRELYQENLVTQKSNIEDRIKNRTPSQRLVNSAEQEIAKNRELYQEDLATQKSDIENRRLNNKTQAEGWEIIEASPSACSAEAASPKSWVERFQATATTVGRNVSQHLGF